jgi:hypothetical protein
MGEFAAKLAMGAFAKGGIVVARRLIAVASFTPNPILVGPSVGTPIEFTLRGIALTAEASINYTWEGETSFLAAGTPLTGQLTFLPSRTDAKITVVTKPLPINSIDRLLVLTFSNPVNAVFVGDTSYSVLLKPTDVGARLEVRDDSYIVVKSSGDNVLNVLANDRASAPITIAAVDQVTDLRIAADNKSLVYNARAVVLDPFVFKYTALVPTTLETAQGNVRLEVEDVFLAINKSATIPYAATRSVDVLAGCTPEGKLEVSAIGTPSNGGAVISPDGESIIFTAPANVGSPPTGGTLSFTVRHKRTGQTSTKTLTLTYNNNNSLMGGRGPISNLPWRSGATGTTASKNLAGFIGRGHDVTMTFGPRGKEDATEKAGWEDIRGGDVTGIALQGCLAGLKQGEGQWILDQPSRFIPIITFDQWPFIYANGGNFRKNTGARRDMFAATADGSFNSTGGLGTTDDIYDAFGAKLKRVIENYGWDGVVVRMNHEANGTESYPHYIEQQDQITPFINATRRAITRIRAAADSNQFQLFFCQNFGRHSNGGAPGPDIWVGKNYCEIFELDFYDRGPPRPITDSASMQLYLNKTTAPSRIYKKRDGVTPLPGCDGPRTWADFARQQGVLFAIGEWGVKDLSESGAEGDNPAFIEGVWNWLNEELDILAYVCYFNQSNSELNKFPQSKAKYKQLWGA